MNENEPNVVINNENGSDSDSSESSSLTESERPSFKRRDSKEDPRLEALINQVGFLSNIYMQSLGGSHNNQSQVSNNQCSNESFLTLPQAADTFLNLGQVAIDIDATKLIKPALPERVDKIKLLQNFGLPTWRNVRYSKSLQSFAATPGFTSLVINDELCHLSKTKDYLVGTENVMAALSNAMFESNDLLRSGLQSVVDWAFKSPEELKASTLLEKIASAVGKGTSFFKNSEDILQIVCGKRAECIETRRERLIKEVPNKCIQLALRNIPPSETCLFDQVKLNTLIQNFGGPQQWLNSLVLTEKNSTTSFKRKNPSHSAPNSFPSSVPKKPRYETPRRNSNFQGNEYKTRGKGKGRGKKSFRTFDQPRL